MPKTTKAITNRASGRCKSMRVPLKPNGTKAKVTKKTKSTIAKKSPRAASAASKSKKQPQKKKKKDESDDEEALEMKEAREARALKRAQSLKEKEKQILAKLTHADLLSNVNDPTLKKKKKKVASSTEQQPSGSADLNEKDGDDDDGGMDTDSKVVPSLSLRARCPHYTPVRYDPIRFPKIINPLNGEGGEGLCYKFGIIRKNGQPFKKKLSGISTGFLLESVFRLHQLRKVSRKNIVNTQMLVALTEMYNMTTIF